MLFNLNSKNQEEAGVESREGDAEEDSKGGFVNLDCALYEVSVWLKKSYLHPDGYFNIKM